MELNALNLKNLRNEEHYKLNLDLTKLVTQFSPDTLGIQTLYPAYQATFEVETLALNVLKASAVTDEVFHADAGRGETYRGLVGTIKSAVNHFDPEVRKSAIRLELLIDSYGNVPSKPYDQETASIIKLVDEFEGPYAADVAILALSGWVTELKNRNLAFDGLKDSRYTESAAKPQQNLKLARLETDKAYRAIVKRINALIEVNGEEAYSGFVTGMNQRIGNYELMLAQRRGRNAKENGQESKKVAKDE